MNTPTEGGDWNAPAHMNPSLFGARLRAARSRAGLTQRELVEKIRDAYGIPLSVRYVISYEKGKVIPPVDVFVAIYSFTRPPEGLGFFEEAMSAAFLRAWRNLLVHSEGGSAAATIDLLERARIKALAQAREIDQLLSDLKHREDPEFLSEPADNG